MRFLVCGVVVLDGENLQEFAAGQSTVYATDLHDVKVRATGLRGPALLVHP